MAVATIRRARSAGCPSPTEANAADEIPRSAAVSLSFTDGWEETVSVEFNLLQRTAKETLGRQITLEEFRQTYAMNKKVEDYVILEGIVVGQHPRTTMRVRTRKARPAQFDYSISDRTVYLETYDGKYGIAVQTATAEDNVFEPVRPRADPHSGRLGLPGRDPRPP